MSEALADSSVCLFCGTSITSGRVGCLEGTVGAKWKAECAQVLSGILSTAGHVEVIKDILLDAKYCMKCDLRNKDLCCSFVMMEKLKNSMAEALGGVVDSICGHHERMSRKKVAGSSEDAVKEALKVIVEDLETSGCPGVNTKETRLLNKLGSTETPETPEGNANVGGARDRGMRDSENVEIVESPCEDNEDEVMVIFEGVPRQEEVAARGNKEENEIRLGKRRRMSSLKEKKESRKGGHFQKIQLGNQRTFKCGVCGIYYSTWQILSHHVLRKHPKGRQRSILNRCSSESLDSERANGNDPVFSTQINNTGRRPGSGANTLEGNNSGFSHFEGAATNAADTKLLRELHSRISSLIRDEPEKLQEIVNIVEASGSDRWSVDTGVTFDFDLCKLSATTIKRLKQAVL